MKQLFQHKSRREAPLVGKQVQVGAMQVRVEALVGQGGYSDIYRVADAAGRLYALKHLRLNGDAEHIAEVQREAKTMAKLRGHPNILRLHAAAFAGPKGSETDGFLLVDHCPDTLLAAMQRASFALDERTVVAVFSAVASGIAHMHRQSPPLAHRDLKAENVLMVGDGTWVLCDFGSATARAGVYTAAADIAAEEDSIRRHTTPAYRAPEMWDLGLQAQRIDTKVDVWAMGVLLFVLAFGRLPFQGDSKLAILYGKYDMPPGRHPLLRTLVRDLLAVDPAGRPSVEAVLARLEPLRALVGITPPAVPGALPVSTSAADAAAPAAPAPAPAPALAAPQAAANGAAAVQPPPQQAQQAQQAARQAAAGEADPPILHADPRLRVHLQQPQQQPRGGSGAGAGAAPQAVPPIAPPPADAAAAARGSSASGGAFDSGADWAGFGDTRAEAGPTPTPVAAAAAAPARSSGAPEQASAPARPPPPVPAAAAGMAPSSSGGALNAAGAVGSPRAEQRGSGSGGPGQHVQHAAAAAAEAAAYQQQQQYAAAQQHAAMAAQRYPHPHLPPDGGGAGVAELRELVLGEVERLRSQVRLLSDQNQAFVMRVKQLESYVVSQKEAMRALQGQVAALSEQQAATTAQLQAAPQPPQLRARQPEPQSPTARAGRPEASRSRDSGSVSSFPVALTPSSSPERGLRELLPAPAAPASPTAQRARASGAPPAAEGSASISSSGGGGAAGQARGGGGGAGAPAPAAGGKFWSLYDGSS
ncbi:MAG: kinase-like domain-containing protein [Monoraphidium minutum]|nr:MAG: kinase-like domain-containing protein [Monoraphidium minutum]